MLEQLQLQTWSKKRMIIVIILLGLLTILLLILEETLTSKEEYKIAPSPKPREWQIPVNGNDAQPAAGSSNNNQVSPIPNEQKSISGQPCWITESFSVEKPCTVCTEFEINSKSPAACVETGLKEVIRCANSGVVYRSCFRIPDVEKRNFLIFESLMLLVAIVAYGVVRFRTSQLERRAAKNIEKRLAQGL